MWQRRAGLRNSPLTILKQPGRIQPHDFVLPTASMGDIRSRRVADRNAAQAAAPDHLGIVLQWRMHANDLKPAADGFA
jgi:hypothetical protein